MDIDGFYVDEDGQIILVDDCGNCTWVDAKRFKVEPETGHWIDDGYYADNSNKSVWRCSKCDHHIIEYDMESYKFCPNCGADMRGDDKDGDAE